MVVVVLCVFDLRKWYSLNFICFWLFSLNTVFFSFNIIITCASSLLLLTTAFKYICVDTSVSLDKVVCINSMLL